MTHTSYGRAGDWLVGTASRNPEALLVLAAGCVLLMRDGSFGRRLLGMEEAHYGATENDDEERSRGNGRRRGTMSAARQHMAEAAESAGEYAGEAYGAAESYARSGARRVSRQASRLGRKAGRLASRTGSATGTMLHEQPLAVAALGLAAGAAVAALLPRMEVEERTLRPARDALAEAAEDAVETVKDVASEAGTRLKDEALDRGLQAMGLKSSGRPAPQGGRGGEAGGEQTATGDFSQDTGAGA
jgi:hypothetical protein